MKKFSILSYLFIFAFAVMSIYSCKKDISEPQPEPADSKSFTDLDVPDGFTWNTAEFLLFDLTFVDADQNPVTTDFEIYNNSSKTVKLMVASTKTDGTFQRKTKISGGATSVWLFIPGEQPIEVALQPATIEIGSITGNILKATATIIVENKNLKSVLAETYQYYPGEGNFGTLLFEDLWPNMGDYDFNDVVIDYNVKSTHDDNDLITRIDMQLYLRAKGGSSDHGFGISFKHSWSFDGPYPDIASVTVNGETIAAEATDYPSYILIPSTMAAMPTLNTVAANPFDEPVLFEVEIVFATPAENWWQVELPLNNPFIFVGGERGKEIHLPYYLPTSLADPFYAGRADDNSDPEAFNPENYKAGNMVVMTTTYLTEDEYPWALDIYINEPGNNLFRYPVEKMDLREAYYPAFDGWVTSWDPWDWYLPEFIEEDKAYEVVPNPIYAGLE
jgi:LruC domain-containing protein